MSWDNLSVSGKGVILVKVKENDGSNYYLTSATNRVIPLHVVKKSGRRFGSLQSLLDFTKLKPSDVMLIEATPENVFEDDGKLEALSAIERRKIWGVENGRD